MVVVQNGDMGSLDDFKWFPKSSSIKIIDFGSTTFEYQNHTLVVATQHYRAPRVILGETKTLFSALEITLRYQ